MLEERTRSVAAAQAKELEKERQKSANLQVPLQEEQKHNESFKEELHSLRLDKEKTFREISKVRNELDAKVAEIKQVQMKLNGWEQQSVGISIENLKEVNKERWRRKIMSLFMLKRSNLEAALEARQRLTSSRHPDSLEKVL